MAWLQFSIPCAAENVEAWSDALMDAGAASVTIANDQAQIFEITPEHKPLWQENKLIALFTEDNEPLIIQHELGQSIDAKSLANGVWSTFVDQDWVKKSQDNMQPMFFGNNLWVCPSWSEIPDPNAINIILDPQMAFGTGSHATTALCLEWLANNIQPQHVVIDYGCGSGILGIAALKLGASKVYGVDIDPLALEISLSNAFNNKISIADDPQLLVYLPEHMPAITADIVVANILAQPLMGMAATLAKFLQPGGVLVLSGILSEQAQQVIEVYQRYFENFDVQTNEAWIRISAKRKT
jgi:ribosomal protein L11 methyltransferase